MKFSMHTFTTVSDDQIMPSVLSETPRQPRHLNSTIILSTTHAAREHTPLLWASVRCWRATPPSRTVIDRVDGLHEVLVDGQKDDRHFGVAGFAAHALGHNLPPKVFVH